MMRSSTVTASAVASFGIARTRSIRGIASPSDLEQPFAQTLQVKEIDRSAFSLPGVFRQLAGEIQTEMVGFRDNSPTPPEE